MKVAHGAVEESTLDGLKFPTPGNKWMRNGRIKMPVFDSLHHGRLEQSE